MAIRGELCLLCFRESIFNVVFARVLLLFFSELNCHLRSFLYQHTVVFSGNMSGAEYNSNISLRKQRLLKKGTGCTKIRVVRPHSF